MRRWTWEMVGSFTRRGDGQGNWMAADGVDFALEAGGSRILPKRFSGGNWREWRATNALTSGIPKLAARSIGILSGVSRNRSQIRAGEFLPCDLVAGFGRGRGLLAMLATRGRGLNEILGKDSSTNEVDPKSAEEGCVGNHAPAIFLEKNSMVAARPSSRLCFGCHPAL